jgi:hypothetical protein
MPSDPRVAAVVASLAQPFEQYRTALAATLEEVRGHVAAGRTDAEARAGRLQGQLGAFAAGRIDVTRLAAVLTERRALDAPARQRLERVSSTLAHLLHEGDALFVLTVPPGHDLAASVAARLATIGRAFAAARVAAAAHRDGADSGLDEDAALEAFPFAEWNAAERTLSPPLVIDVEGRDLLAGGLAPFLDGSQKLLLVARGECPPAPLVRLLTPGVLVVQAHDEAELDVLSRWRGPAVAAIVSGSAARFVHHPEAGPEPWQRLTILSGADERRTRLGGLTAAQQNEELRQLQALAAGPAIAAAANPTPVAAGPSADDSTMVAADRLAAWLLQHAALPTAAPGK